VIYRTPEIMRLAIDPDEHLVQVPTPVRIRRFLISLANIGPKRFHQNRTVS
jgi:hypothetical protein